MCREILIFEIFLSRDAHLRNTHRIFLATPTLYADTQTTKQNIEKAWHFLVDRCLVNKTAQPFLLVLRHPISVKFNRRTFRRFTLYRLLTLL